MVRFSETSAASDPDAQLMLQVRAGSEQAFNKLLERYQDRVRGIIIHLMGGTAYADDLTQEVFLRLFRARKSYVIGAKFSTWLFTILNNVVSNARRGLARCHEVSFDHGLANGSNLIESFAISQRESSPEYQAQSRESAELVRDCISRLIDRQRAAVELCDIEGLSYNHVAEAIGTSPDAAKSLIHRGRSNLRKLLEPHIKRGNI